MKRAFYPKPFPKESILSIALRACGADTITLSALMLNLDGPSSNIHALLVPALMGQRSLLHDLANMDSWIPPKPHAALLQNGSFGRWINYDDGGFCTECARLGALPWIHDFQAISVCLRHRLKFVSHCDKCRRIVTWNRRDLNICICGHTLKGGVKASAKDLERGTFVERLLVSLQFERLERILAIEKVLDARYGIANVDVNILDRFVKGETTALAPIFRVLIRRLGNLPPRAVLAPLLNCGGWIKLQMGMLDLLLHAAYSSNSPILDCPLFYLNRRELAYALDTQLTTAGAIQTVFLGKSKSDRKELTGEKLIELYTTLTPIKTGEEGMSARLLKMTGDQAVSAVRRGQLLVVAYDATKPLSTMRFMKTNQHNAWLTLNEAASKLGTYYEAVRHLGKTGILPVQYHEAQYRVDPANLANFNDKYILIGEIARRAGTNDRRLSEKVMAWGPKPASGPLVDGGLTYLFRRKDIEKLDLRQVVATTDYATNSGRRPRPISDARCLDGTATAKALGVSIQRLGQFEETGLLRREYPSSGLANRRYYCAKSVRRAATFVSKLVPFSELERTCSLQGGRLVSRYRSICDAPMYQIRGSARQVSPTAAKAMQHHVEQFWDATTSAKHLGVTKQDIQNWRRLGYLMPLQEGERGFISWPMLYKRKDIIAFEKSSIMMQRAKALKRKRLRH